MTTNLNDLAGTLRRLRKAAGLSGERLAARCAMSQPKISRIESGKVLPTVIDVERILKALAVPPDAATELLDMARQANVEHTSLRAIAETGYWRKQHELRALAESSKDVRHFLPAMPSGLIQTAEYARAAMSPVVASDPVVDTERAVAARLERQQALDDETRRFTFLLTEQAVRWRYADRATMARQCEHLARVAEMPNVTVLIVPISAEVAGPALNGFTVYDNRLVIAELLSGDVTLSDPRDVSYHLELFEFFAKHTLRGARAASFLLAARDDFM